MKKGPVRRSLGAGGFTLIELLVSITIIGLLSAVGTVSYSYVRAKARDAKRVADIRTIRNAIETYFEQNGKYPPASPLGLELGTENASVVSDAGITSQGLQSGLLYLQVVPFNILPGGAPYIYHSTYNDGTVCGKDCPNYEVTFQLETPTGELFAGPHLLTSDGIQGGESGSTGVSVIAQLLVFVPTPEQVAAAFGTAQETAELARQAAARPEVQAANRAVVAPIAVVSAGASMLAALAAALPLANAGQFMLLLAAQPLLALTRRKRQGWGTVYDAATKVPIDLAVVRLIDASTRRVAAAKVTDKDGRFAFTPKAGSYRLEAQKPGFVSPSASLSNVSDDGKFTDIYHGTLIAVAESGATLTVNVPMDAEQAPLEDARALLSVRNKKALRKAFAATGPLLGLVALAVTPGLPMLLLFLLQIFFYQIFKRVAEPPAPKSQGVVHDIDTLRPIDGAVVRVLSLPYHKVLESRLTDARGRYSFHVGAGSYYLTAMKLGYEKTVTEPIDFTKIDKPAWIASDLPMRKASASPGLDDATELR